MKIHITEQNIQIVPEQGIKGSDVMVNLVWANTSISGYVMRNSAGIILGNSEAFRTSLCIFAPQLASMHWHAVGTK